MTKNVVLKYKLHIKKERFNQIGRWIVWQLCYLCSYIKDPKEQYYQRRMNPILGSKTSLVAQMVECLLTMRETRIQSLGWEDLLEKEMATHSSTLAWKIPWAEEAGRLQSMGSQRVRHHFTFTFFRFKRSPETHLLLKHSHSQWGTIKNINDQPWRWWTNTLHLLNFLCILVKFHFRLTLSSLDIGSILAFQFSLTLLPIICHVTPCHFYSFPTIVTYSVNYTGYWHLILVVFSLSLVGI